jgi:hypothetical protein
MSEEDSKDNEREDDKKPQGVLSEGLFTGFRAFDFAESPIFYWKQ